MLSQPSNEGFLVKNASISLNFSFHQAPTIKLSSSYQESKTLATLGQGVIITTDDSDTRRLNRDIDASDTALYSHERSQGDIDVTVDTRLLSESGRQQVKNDFVDNYEFGEDIYRSAEQLSVSDQRD